MLPSLAFIYQSELHCVCGQHLIAVHCFPFIRETHHLFGLNYSYVCFNLVDEQTEAAESQRSFKRYSFRRTSKKKIRNESFFSLASQNVYHTKGNFNCSFLKGND